MYKTKIHFVFYLLEIKVIEYKKLYAQFFSNTVLCIIFLNYILVIYLKYYISVIMVLDSNKPTLLFCCFKFYHLFIKLIY